jgi:hypothetical protein
LFVSLLSVSEGVVARERNTSNANTKQGMFNVLASLGGGGQLTADLSNKANMILYSIFAGLALISGPVCNYLGPKITLAIGGVGYALYAASFWSYNHTANDGFVLFAGAACGFSAAFLW